MKTAKSAGDNKPPCLTPAVTANAEEKQFAHLTTPTHLCNVNNALTLLLKLRIYNVD